jgi:hypothetical protein
LKKENIPHRAKVEATPPTNQFQRLAEAEKYPCHTTQIITPRAAANIRSPAPNNASEPSHALAPKAINRGINKYSNAIMTTTNITLRTIGEATKLKRLFFPAWFLLVFCFGL